MAKHSDPHGRPDPMTSLKDYRPRHHDDCGYYRSVLFTCTCGLDALLAAPEPPAVDDLWLRLDTLANWGRLNYTGLQELGEIKDDIVARIRAVRVKQQEPAPAVAEAREALVAAIIENSAQVRCDGSYPTLIPTARIDVLIAAVRVEGISRATTDETHENDVSRCDQPQPGSCDADPRGDNRER